MATINITGLDEELKEKIEGYALDMMQFLRLDNASLLFVNNGTNVIRYNKKDDVLVIIRPKREYGYIRRIASALGMLADVRAAKEDDEMPVTNDTIIKATIFSLLFQKMVYFDIPIKASITVDALGLEYFFDIADRMETDLGKYCVEHNMADIKKAVLLVLIQNAIKKYGTIATIYRDFVDDEYFGMGLKEDDLDYDRIILLQLETYVYVFITFPDRKTETIKEIKEYARKCGIEAEVDMVLSGLEIVFGTGKMDDTKPDADEQDIQTVDDDDDIFYQGNYTNFSSLPKGCKNIKCGDFISDDSGVIFVKKAESEDGEDKKIPVSEIPMTITHIYENMENRHKLIGVAYKDGRNWETILFQAQDLIASTSAAKKEFGARGIAANNNVFLYLKEIYNLNKDGILFPERYVEQLGWVDGELVPYSKKCMFFSTDNNINSKKNAITSKGDLSKWVEMVNSVRKEGYILAKIALAASFSSILIKNFEISNTYIISIYGKPRSGKSVLMNMGASIWGNRDKLIGNFNQTIPFIFSNAAFYNDFPNFLDDTANRSKEVDKGFENLVYSLFGGAGKGKMSGGGKQALDLRWKACTIVTGERPTADFVTQEGGKTRIVDIKTPDKVFENDTLVNYIMETINHNYGAAGQVYAEAVQKLGPDRIRNIFLNYNELLKNLSYVRYDRRTLDAFAGILTGDRIACTYVYHDLDNALTVEELVNAVGAGQTDDDIFNTCYEAIIARATEETAEPFAMEDSTNPDYYVLDKDSFRGFIIDNFEKIDVAEFPKWLKRKGLILADSGKTTKNKRINGVNTPVYFIKKPEIDVVKEVSDEDRQIEQKYLAEIDSIIRSTE